MTEKGLPGQLHPTSRPHPPGCYKETDIGPALHSWPIAVWAPPPINLMHPWYGSQAPELLERDGRPVMIVVVLLVLFPLCLQRHIRQVKAVGVYLCMCVFRPSTKCLIGPLLQLSRLVIPLSFCSLKKLPPWVLSWWFC